MTTHAEWADLIREYIEEDPSLDPEQEQGLRIALSEMEREHLEAAGLLEDILRDLDSIVNPLMMQNGLHPLDLNTNAIRDYLQKQMPPGPENEWRERFIKYINIVGEAEGLSFLSPRDWPEDWEWIRKAQEEAEARYDEG